MPAQSPSEPEQTQASHTGRRTVLLGVGLAGAAGVLTACGKSNSASGQTPPASPAGQSSGPPSSAPAEPSTPASGGAGGGGALGAASEIPLGGGKVFSDQKIVVTQPARGEYKAFSAVCTHMGCTVDKVASGTIDCPCHGSKYSIKDAHVVAGPAPRPLDPKSVSVSGGQIIVS